MSLEQSIKGIGPDGSSFVAADESELKLLQGKRVIIGICDGNRFTFYASKPFCERITERDVKMIAGRLETTLRVVCAQVGNILR